MRIRWMIAAMLLALVAPTALAQTQVLAAGDAENLWLLAYEQDGEELTVRRRGDVSTWQGKVSGPPAAACAVGENLHVFFAGGEHTYFDYRLVRHVGRWPSQWAGVRIYTACTSRTSSTVYLLLELDDSQLAATTTRASAGTQPATIGAATQPATATAEAQTQTQPATTPSGRRPVIQKLSFGQWSYVADVPSGLLPADAVYSMTEMNGQLYVLACDAQRRPVWLKRLVNDQWEDLAELAWKASDGVAVALEAVHDLWLVSQAPHGGQPALWLRRVDEGKLNPSARIMLSEGSPVSPDEGAAAVIARSGSQLALAWRQEGQWKVGNLELSGRVENVQSLASRDEDKLLGRIAEFVQWAYFGIVGGLTAFWYLRRRALARQPFLLPPHLVPGFWLKRLIAFGLDFTPILLASALAFGIKPIEAQNLSEYLQQAKEAEGAGRALLAWLVAMGVYCAYCIALEALTGATLGKRLLGLQVVDENGRRPAVLAIVVRNVLKLVELQVPIVFVAAVWPIFSAYRQRFGDAVARTAVVDRRFRAIVPPPAPGEEPPGNGGGSK